MEMQMEMPAAANQLTTNG